MLLRESDVLAATGYTLLLSASNKRFLGELLDLPIDDRREASLAAVAYGVARRMSDRARPRCRGNRTGVPHGRSDPGATPLGLTPERSR